MMKLTFDLPPTLNQIINNNRAGKRSGAGMKSTWTNKAVRTCKQQARQCPIVPVYLAAHYTLSTRANDVDNVQASKKFILDGIVKSGVLKDDSFSYIQPVIFETFEFIGRSTKANKKKYYVDIFIFTDYNEYKKYIINLI